MSAATDPAKANDWLLFLEGGQWCGIPPPQRSPGRRPPGLRLTISRSPRRRCYTRRCYDWTSCGLRAQETPFLISSDRWCGCSPPQPHSPPCTQPAASTARCAQAATPALRRNIR